MLIRYFNAEIQIVSLVNFALLSQGSFVPSLASVTKSAVVGHFLSLREPTTYIFLVYDERSYVISAGLLVTSATGTSCWFSFWTSIKTTSNCHIHV